MKNEYIDSLVEISQNVDFDRDLLEIRELSRKLANPSVPARRKAGYRVRLRKICAQITANAVWRRFLEDFPKKPRKGLPANIPWLESELARVNAHISYLKRVKSSRSEIMGAYRARKRVTRRLLEIKQNFTMSKMRKNRTRTFLRTFDITDQEIKCCKTPDLVKAARGSELVCQNCGTVYRNKIDFDDQSRLAFRAQKREAHEKIVKSVRVNAEIKEFLIDRVCKAGLTPDVAKYFDRVLANIRNAKTLLQLLKIFDYLYEDNVLVKGRHMLGGTLFAGDLYRLRAARIAPGKEKQLDSVRHYRFRASKSKMRDSLESLAESIPDEESI